MRTDRAAVLNKLVEIRYERNDYDFHRGAFRVRGDIVDVFPAYESEAALRFEFFGDVLESITEIDPLRGKTIRTAPEGAHPSGKPLRYHPRQREARNGHGARGVEGTTCRVKGRKQAGRGAEAGEPHPHGHGDA